MNDHPVSTRLPESVRPLYDEAHAAYEAWVAASDDSFGGDDSESILVALEVAVRRLATEAYRAAAKPAAVDKWLRRSFEGASRQPFFEDALAAGMRQDLVSVMSRVPSAASTSRPDPAEWHYAVQGQRHGPVTTAALKSLMKSDAIAADALLWHPSFADWQPVSSTDFATAVRNPLTPPPLTGAAVSNGVVWTLAFAPLIGALLAGFLSGASGVPVGSFWFTTLVLNIALGYLDARRLKMAGHNILDMGAVWLVPVYLYKRAKVLKQSNSYFVVWCVLFALMFLF